MSPERWQLVKRLLDQVLQHAPEERTAWLAHVCADDQALRSELETLLRAADDPLSLMDAPLEQVATLLIDVEHPERIGPYRILKTLGHGGMGVVYLAERPEIARQVAIKVVASGRTSSDYVQRFLMERRVLARLQHPNIAQLLDIGITESGLPYFVMEYVEGVPITTYCDENRCTVVERLRLFLTVCEAVEYAHSNLVIHRDLKPSNILVSQPRQPDTGSSSNPGARVKLLDFGIAKLMEEAPDQPELTLTGMRVMTPAYASPEQVRGTDVTTASDVYSLGVLLYELLSGQRPYQVEGKRPSEIEHIVCETDPPRPSTVIGTTDSTVRPGADAGRMDPESIATARGVRLERLKKLLRGDLDTILLKSLRKEARERYRSVEQFMDDVKRYLNGIPVQARPSTIGYRVGKFARRHRAGMMMMGAFVGILIAVVSLFLIEITIERDRARQEAAKAEQVKEFMVDVFRSSDPGTAPGDTITARELLDRGVQRIQTELNDQSAVQADMLDAIGRVYNNLGRFENAIPLLERALELRQSMYGAEHPDVASSLDILGQVMYGKGRFDTADSLLQQALDMRQRLLDDGELGIAVSSNNLGLVAQAQGDLEKAEPLFRKSLEIGLQIYGPDSPRNSTDYHNLALVLERKGEYTEAKQLYLKALALDRSQKNDVHPDVATDLHSLARLLYITGDYDSAYVLNQEALRLYEQLYSEAHPYLGNSLHNQALVLHNLGRLDEAEAMFEKTYALEESIYGPDAPIMAITFKNLALVYLDQERLDEAEHLLQEAMALQYVLSANHPRKADVQMVLGLLRIKQERYLEAEEILKDVLDIRKHSLPGDHWKIAEAKSVLGRCLVGQNRFDEAEILLQEGYARLFEKLGPGHKLTRRAQVWLTELSRD